METKVRVTILGAKDSHAHFTSSNGLIDVVEKPVAGLHVHTIQKRWNPIVGKVVEEKPGDVLFRVNTTVVYKDFDGRTNDVTGKLGRKTLHGFCHKGLVIKQR